MLRDWKRQLILRIDISSSTPVYIQITEAIIEDIQGQRVEAGDVLPSSRELSKELQVNRKTVIAAYDELKSQGWVSTDKSRGTFVALELPVINKNQALPDEKSIASSINHDVTLPPAVVAVFPTSSAMAIDDGLPDTSLFPTFSYAKAHRRALIELTRKGLLGYGDPRGSSNLRSELSRMLNIDRGLATKPENICVTRGSQMALFTLARVLIHPGDYFAVEELTYPPAREAFKSSGAQIVTIKIDEDGIDVDHLEKQCRKYKIKAIYLTPGHQYPTTVLMKPDRRLRLLALAEQFGFIIIEDDYDHEFHFEHRPLLPLARFAPERTIYIGSLSKLLAPNLRIGYISASESIISRIAQEILIIDRQGDQVGEEAIADMLSKGEVQRYARKSVGIYRKRREYFAERLESELKDRICFDKPQGGLAFWIRFADIKYLENIERADSGLKLLPSVLYSGNLEGKRGIRIGFASLNEQRADQVIQKLMAYDY